MRVREGVHPTAVIDEDVTLGVGCRVWHFCHLMPGCVVGDGTSMGQNVMVGRGVVLGRGCKIQNNVSLYEGVTLEDSVFCGPSMVFTNVWNPRAHISRMHEARPTRVCKGASLGANCTVVCGVTIGCWAFVGAGAVITKDVPAHALVYGNPARRRGWVCACGEKLNSDLLCPVCGAAHRPCGTGLEVIPPTEGV